MGTYKLADLLARVAGPKQYFHMAFPLQDITHMQHLSSPFPWSGGDSSLLTLAYSCRSAVIIEYPELEGSSKSGS